MPRRTPPAGLTATPASLTLLEPRQLLCGMLRVGPPPLFPARCPALIPVPHPPARRPAAIIAARQKQPAITEEIIFEALEKIHRDKARSFRPCKNIQVQKAQLELEMKEAG